MTEKFDYRRYLASREWALKKKAIRERSGGLCERCLMDVMSIVHHLTYEHVGNEPFDDLQGLCHGCHEYLSAASDVDPADRVMWSLGFAALLRAGVTEEAVTRAIRRTVRLVYEHIELAGTDEEESVANFWQFTREHLKDQDVQ